MIVQPAKNYTWDLSLLYKSDSDPQIEKDVKISKKEISDFVKKYKTAKAYLKDPKALHKALLDYEILANSNHSIDKAWFYYYLRRDQNAQDITIKKQFNNINQTATELSNSLTFFTLKISKIPKNLQPKMLAYKPLQKYSHMLKRLFIEGKYLLSEKEENLFSLLSKPAYSNWTQFLEEQVNKTEGYVTTTKGIKKKQPFNQIIENLSSRDSKLRDSSAKIIHKIVYEKREIATEELNSILEFKRVSDKLRGHIRPDEARHISDDIDTSVVDAMVSAVTKRFDLSKRYYKARARILGKKRLKYHERTFPLNPKSLKYEFSQAQKIVLSTYTSLDPELGELAKNFFSQRRFDVFPQKGKSGGAYCAAVKPKYPTYILLNYSGNESDILTIAHELGHGINNELIAKHQDILNYGTPTSTAEVASTFFEDFVFENLNKSISDSTKRLLLMDKLGNDVSTIFRQVALYNFEKELHATFRKQMYLSAKEISAMFKTHMQAYMGPAVSADKGSENWWVHWSHIRSPFYVYSYASGLLISKALQAMVQKDPKTISKVKTFLSTGLSKSPKEIFLELGIDITKKEFWEKGLNRIDDMLKSI
ncbi:M3 family oligoendopeptidase [Candidatus Dojkabacteria bacterium]|nr:M3 family oligoendopeptidase [Candidatus Dojkabacteria bacterium]